MIHHFLTVVVLLGILSQASSPTQTPSPETQALGKGWDAAYVNPEFNTGPNAFLADAVRDLKPGTALDVGMGDGRNALYLARLGWTVTGFDPSEVGVGRARAAAGKEGLARTTFLQQRSQEFNWGTDQWDLIVLTYFPAVRQTVAQIMQSLRPGGFIVVESFHNDSALERPPGPALTMRFADNELLRLFPDLRVVRYEDVRDRADWGMFDTRLVRLFAQKRAKE